MVSRRFLIEQATLNALAAYFPQALALEGPAPSLKCIGKFIDREDHWFCQSVRKHFVILDRREREYQDVVRLDQWREVSGGIK